MNVNLYAITSDCITQDWTSLCIDEYWREDGMFVETAHRMTTNALKSDWYLDQIDEFILIGEREELAEMLADTPICAVVDINEEGAQEIEDEMNDWLKVLRQEVDGAK